MRAARMRPRLPAQSAYYRDVDVSRASSAATQSLACASRRSRSALRHVSTEGRGDVRDKRIISARVASRASRRFASQAASVGNVPA